MSPSGDGLTIVYRRMWLLLRTARRAATASGVRRYLNADLSPLAQGQRHH